jgi:predicted dehydrogenase
MSKQTQIRWGILSTAKIAREHIIPAIHKSQFGAVVAIASRNGDKVAQVARNLDIPEHFDSYDAMISSPLIDAIYNPLPNDMHVPWTLKAIKAGKHVLCEKPIGLNAREAEHLLEHTKKHPEIKVMEAFMYRFHPQWQLVKSLIEGNKIGKVISVNTTFTYYKDEPENIRNDPEKGGGGLMDVGCYCISIARWIIGKEPQRVSGFFSLHPQYKVDTQASAILDFGNGVHSTFNCGTQTHPEQHVEILGSSGKIIVHRPVNVAADHTAKILLESNGVTEEIDVDMANQYILQLDYFSRSILDQTDVPTPLTDAVANMRVIDALVKSGETGSVEHVRP